MYAAVTNQGIYNSKSPVAMDLWSQNHSLSSGYHPRTRMVLDHKSVAIITLLTQVRKEKNGKINFHPGIEPGTQRLGVQYTRHQAITHDKSLSPHSSLCTASGCWRICQPHTDRPPNSCASRVHRQIPVLVIIYLKMCQDWKPIIVFPQATCTCITPAAWKYPL